MTLDIWLTFAILELLLCLTPGPAVLFVTTTTAERGFRAGAIGTAGILTSNLMYFVISGTGVAAVLVTSPTLFSILRWGGSLYLLWLGSRMLLAKRSAADPVQEVNLPAERQEISILHGFMVQTLNPKAIAFFSALLPQFVNPAFALIPQMTILTVTSVVIEASVMFLYIWLTLRYGKHAGTRGKRWFKQLGGAFLILAALRMAVFG